MLLFRGNSSKNVYDTKKLVGVEEDMFPEHVRKSTLVFM